MTTRPWEASADASFVRRLGKSPLELGNTTADPSCPDIWELSDGNIAIIGRDLTTDLENSLPADANIGSDERLVVIPRNTFESAVEYIEKGGHHEHN